MKLRLRDPDYVLICDALEEYQAIESNKICSDYAETNGLDAMRLAEKNVLHASNLIERIRRARSK
jgi:hypothetical protein